MTAGRRAVTLVAVVAGIAAAACTQPPSGGLSVTPGPNATSSLVPAEDGTPAPSTEGGDAGGATGGTDASGGPNASGRPSVSGAPDVSGLPMASPPNVSASDAPAAS